MSDSWRESGVYSATFKRVDVADDSVLAFKLRRRDYTNAESTCTFPGELEITEPVGDRLFSKDRFSRDDDDITVRWGAVDDPEASVSVVLSSKCGDYAEVTLEGDPGAHTFAAGEYLEVGEGKTCAATVTVNRYQPGELDAAFEWGWVSCEQVRSVDITIDP